MKIKKELQDKQGITGGEMVTKIKVSKEKDQNKKKIRVGKKE